MIFVAIVVFMFTGLMLLNIFTKFMEQEPIVRKHPSVLIGYIGAFLYLIVVMVMSVYIMRL